MIIVYAMGHNPVFVISLGATLDGILLTPLQAIGVAVGLYFVLPRLVSKEVYETIKPSWVFAPILIVTAIVFGFFCSKQL
ncbi:hypothetical protein FJY63_10795 [Candidatus Sumerlaeota bacterium]|nr:hypothetical protein [Candidatus Sumerlaeota bacterium]